MLQFIISQVYRSKEDKDKYLAEAKAARIEELSRKEKGNIRYEYLLPTDEDEKRLILLEQWETAADQQAHTKSDHFAIAMELKKQYIESSNMERYECQVLYSGKDPEFEEGDVFKITVPLDSLGETQATPKVNPSYTQAYSELSEKEKRIVQIIAEAPELTQKEIAERAGYNVNSVKTLMRGMKIKGVLLREGNSQYWQMVCAAHQSGVADPCDYEEPIGQEVLRFLSFFYYPWKKRLLSAIL